MVKEHLLGSHGTSIQGSHFIKTVIYKLVDTFCTPNKQFLFPQQTFFCVALLPVSEWSI